MRWVPEAAIPAARFRAAVWTNTRVFDALRRRARNPPFASGYALRALGLDRARNGQPLD